MTQEFIYKKGDVDPYTGEVYTQTTIVYRNANNEVHRDDDLPAIIQADGTNYWLTNGKLNRQTVNSNGELLPAVINTVTGYHKFSINGTTPSMYNTNLVQLNLYK